ncbi:MAG: metallopeptidase family protein [Nannocystaceae bacterium]
MFRTWINGAAAVCLYDLDDPVRGLRYCTDALELETLGPFELLDVHLVAAECELAADSGADATRRLASLDEEPVLMSALRLGARPDLLDEVDRDDPDSADAVAWEHLWLDPDGEPLDEEERVDRIGRALQLAFRLARLRLDLGETDAATQTLTELLRWYPGEPDAWYLASEAHHRAGRLPEACVAAVKTLELDHDAEVPDWVPSFAIVHRRVIKLLKESPEPTLGALVQAGRPLTVMVRDAPAPELVMEGVDPRVPVLALAARQSPMLEPSSSDLVEDDPPAAPQLTGLAVYRRNLARFVRDAEHFEQELRYAVLDELAAFVGLDDASRQRLGLPPVGDAAGLPPEPAPEEAAADADEAAKGSKKRARRRRSRVPN